MLITARWDEQLFLGQPFKLKPDEAPQVYSNIKIFTNFVRFYISAVHLYATTMHGTMLPHVTSTTFKGP